MRLLICDFSGIHRAAWHASQDADAPREITLRKIRKTADGYDACVVALDSSTSRRKRMDPTYKANREPPSAMCVQSAAECVAALRREGFSCFEADGEEGDDIIASFVAWARSQTPPHEVTILGNDKDLTQCLGNGVYMVPTKGDAIDAGSAFMKYGVEPAKFAQFQALCGDSTDNVKGVVGCGPVNAAKLLKAHGNIAGIARAAMVDPEPGKQAPVHPPAIRKAVLEALGHLDATLALVTLRTDLGLSLNFESMLELDVARRQLSQEQQPEEPPVRQSQPNRGERPPMNQPQQEQQRPPSRKQERADRIRRIFYSQAKTLAAIFPTDGMAMVTRAVSTACSASMKMDDNVTAESIAEAAIACHHLGLEVGDQAYIYPHGNAAKLTVGPRGLVALAYRGGFVRSIKAISVFRGDVFDYNLGEDTITHKKAETGRRPEKKRPEELITHAYCVIETTTDGRILDVLTWEDIAFYRSFSKARQGPWIDNFEGMCRKTALKRALEFVPRSALLSAALREDENSHYSMPEEIAALVDKAIRARDGKPETAKAAEPEPQQQQSDNDGDELNYETADQLSQPLTG